VKRSMWRKLPGLWSRPDPSLKRCSGDFDQQTRMEQRRIGDKPVRHDQTHEQPRRRQASKGSRDSTALRLGLLGVDSGEATLARVVGLGTGAHSPLAGEAPLVASGIPGEVGQPITAACAPMKKSDRTLVFEPPRLR
jgi:hypothetical protein